MKIRVVIAAAIISCCLGACGKKAEPTRFTLQENTGIGFVNALSESKAINVFGYRNFYNGGGVATGDLNNDGLPEVFFTANQSSNKLYLNKGKFVFEDITEKAGIDYRGEWSTGVVFVDINSDGWLDIYVCNAGNMMDKALRKNRLYINNKDLTFTEQAAAYGLDNDGYSTQAAFFDYDLDGDLDCFLVNNSPIPVNTLNYANMRNLPDSAAPYADFLKGGGDHLYRNDNGHFTEVTYASGIYGSIISFGLGVSVGDINDDGYPDVYVSNDFFEKDYVYINQRNGTFRDEAELRTQHLSFSSMGSDMADINNDGYQDVFTTDMLPGDDYRLKTNTSFEGFEVFRLKQNQGFYNQFTQNALQVNDGQGNFLETAFYSGVSASDWSWGALIFDADNDGLSDIFVSNGIFRDVTDQDFIDFFANEIVGEMALNGKKEEVEKVIDKMPSVPIPNSMFRNKGQLRFEDRSRDWGLDKASFSNGASYADLDADGDLDLIVNNVNQRAMVYKNNTREREDAPYIGIAVRFQSPNLFGIGTTVKLFCQDQVIRRELYPSRGFQSGTGYVLTIGLGKLTPDSMQVIWPDGTCTSMNKPAIDSTHMVRYDPSSVRRMVRSSISISPLFQPVDVPFDTAREDDYVDFYAERNIPFMLSRLGPRSAVGDVNGDGLDDLFIGMPRNEERQLYLQTKAGFVRKPVPDFKRITFNDVTAAFFFDADQDGDLDLFNGGGGNVEPASSDAYQNFLFLNDGKGNFTLRPGSFPISHTNCGAAIPLDFDGDGKMDIFVGSRSEPQQYGMIPRSFLFRNTGAGVFEDMTARIAPSLEKVGMVTNALWVDFNKDGRKELWVSGDWMYPQIYQWENGRFEARKTGLEAYSGWWQSAQAADLDGDGDEDLVLGNIGQNFYLQADSVHPVKLWIKDVDKNGAMEKIMSRTVAGKDVPVFLKKDLTDQVPSLKKLNLRHRDYAARSIQDLLGNDVEGAVTRQVNCTYSAIAINDGNGMFRLKPLPLELQLSSIQAICVADINGDGRPDIVTGGNFFDLLPQFCRLDASYGQVLINTGDGNFRATSGSERGMHIKGQIREIARISYMGANGFIFMVNGEKPLMFKAVTQGKSK